MSPFQISIEARSTTQFRRFFTARESTEPHKINIDIRRMPRKKKTKTKLSPEEKRDRKRLRVNARRAKKREDPAYLLKESEKRANKREDQDDVRDKENAVVDPSFRAPALFSPRSASRSAAEAT